MLGQLLPCGGGRPIPLSKAHLVVGRDAACDIPLRIIIVSARHCELEFRDGHWFVQDLKSTNGTRVNGKPCGATPERLMPNDELWVAGCRFKVAYTAPASKEAAPKPAKEAAPKSAPPAPISRPSTPSTSKPSLGVLIPCGGGRPIPLLKPTVLVGRHPRCDIVLPNGTVSARHCQLDFFKGIWHARDLGSRNGIRINGMRTEEGELLPESILTISTDRYRIVYEGPAGSGPEEPSVFDKSLLERAGLTGWRIPEERDEDDTDPQRLVLE
jgi:pSer/pThr/pTyr-binding forkhead associated (FHA) protein